MVKLYAAALDQLQNGAWRNILDDLSHERRRRAEAVRGDADAARIAGAGALLNRALLAQGIETPVFVKNEWGKPELAGPDTIHFSLSHSGPWAVCVVGPSPLGVDIESARCTMQVARRFFSQDELKYLEALPEQEQTVALARLWPAKEAFLKALGTGLHQPLDSFTVELTEKEARLIQRLSPLPYRLHEYRLGVYYLALCCVDEDVEFSIVELVRTAGRAGLSV